MTPTSAACPIVRLLPFVVRFSCGSVALLAWPCVYSRVEVVTGCRDGLPYADLAAANLITSYVGVLFSLSRRLAIGAIANCSSATAHVDSSLPDNPMDARASGRSLSNLRQYWSHTHIFAYLTRLQDLGNLAPPDNHKPLSEFRSRFALVSM